MAQVSLCRSSGAIVLMGLITMHRDVTIDNIVERDSEEARERGGEIR